MTFADEWILRGYTRLAHVLQRWTGKTCYWFAQQCAVVLMLRDALWILEFPMFVAVIGVMCWLLLALLAARVDREFHNNPTTLPSGVIMAKSGVSRVSRLMTFAIGTMSISVLLTSPHRLVDLLLAISGVAMPSFQYLMAVTPMPPARQRDRVRGTLIPHLSGAR